MSNSLIIVGSFVGILIVYFYFNYRKMRNMPMVADSEKIKVLNDTNFGHQIKSGVTLVDFWAEWCAPCKMMAPVLNELADDLNGPETVGKLNVEHSQSTASKYNVRSIPTMILFKNGKEINRFVGVKSKDFLKKEINKVSQ